MRVLVNIQTEETGLITVILSNVCPVKEECSCLRNSLTFWQLWPADRKDQIKAVTKVSTFHWDSHMQSVR